MYGQLQISSETMKKLNILRRIKHHFRSEKPECSCGNSNVVNISDSSSIYPVYVCRNCGREFK